MSVVSQILTQQANLTAAIHGDTMTLQPMGLQVIGYAQEVSADPDEKGLGKKHPSLHTGMDDLSYIIYVRKSEIGNTNLSNVNTIIFFDRTYRVQHYVNDPVTPEIAFYCKIA
jgi:hypothetical protein